MNDVIRLLPDAVANQIAAGEVIQRPSSVVKELVENAVDAGATIVKLLIKDAGRTLIQVSDNGCGMSPTDARLAFDRHSTSKITVADDLFSLHTMGFRGEALASICAVSEVELRTMRQGDGIGTKIVIAGSKVESQEPVSAAPGSTMMVKRLFYNVPARRKFLKSDSVEMGHIMREFERLALVNPDVEFELIHNDTLIHRLLAGTLKQRIVDLFGRSMDAQLVPINSETSIVSIEGFVGRPENARKRGALQYFMVNGRNMRHPFFHRAVMTCFDKLIANDSQPNYFINITVDPQTIDVNIHPTKNEIKFENEQSIWQILMATVREALGKFNVAPAIDFASSDAIELPDFLPDPGLNPNVSIDANYNPFRATVSSVPSNLRCDKNWNQGLEPVTSDWDKLYSGFIGHGADQMTQSSDYTTSASALNDKMEALFDDDVKPHSSMLQLKKRYILMSAENGLMIVDQHRAHIAVMYYQFVTQVTDGRLVSQRLIFPEILSLTQSEIETLKSITGELDRLGFEFQVGEDLDVTVCAMPAALVSVSAYELIPEIINLTRETALIPGSSVIERIALGMARSCAISASQSLSDAEMNKLVSDLFALPEPNYTPDGRKTISNISIDSINKLFV